MTTPGISFPLADIVRETIVRLGVVDRQLQEDGFWCHVTGPAPIEQVQGWKLHLSATPLSAPIVLHAATQILLSSGCQFKFAKDLDRVTELTSVRYDRAQAGKFIAAYPADEEEFHRLADALCDATVGMPGPTILSDRQYRPGSIVQYRFGAFRGVPVLTDDGSFESRLRDPDGNLVADRRKPWFTPPAWVPPLVPRGLADSATAPAAGSATAPAAAVPPAGSAAPAAAPDKPARPTLADGRFEVLRALRHSARGGVYQATDTKTGYSVLIKEARAHIGGDRRGQDSRALLGYEAKVLAALSPLTPALVSLFDVADHTFLAEEFVEGRSLSRHIAQLGGTHQLAEPAARALAQRLVRLVHAVHEQGWALRDLNSNNVMVRPDGDLVLIDTEHAARPGDVVGRIFTPGFVAPETLHLPAFGPAPAAAVDRFALGAMLVHLVLGMPPAFLSDDRDAARTLSQRIAGLLALAEDERPLIRQWWPLLTGLCEADPDRRWTLAQATDFLRDDPVATAVPPARPGDASVQRVIADGLDHLLSSRRPDAGWLWEADGFGATTDPLNVQYGAAGVLAVLARAAGHGHAEAADALPAVTGWMRERLDRVPRLLPGLYFGRAGTAWALREAADVLADVELAECAEEFGLRLPVSWRQPDVCHGTAGLGLAQLRLWQLSGRAEFLDRARRCADQLADAARETEDGVFWPVPDDLDSVLAGAWHFGFAHGVAGVGAFLLAAAQACGEPRYLELAGAAGRTLSAAATLDEGTGAMTWRTDRNQPVGAGDMLLHWCNGASGVGTFLVRLARIAEQQDEASAARYRELVHGAALAVHRARFGSSPAACHGLAGNGQFLLDAADDAARTGSSRAAQYRRWAEDVAAVLVARAAWAGGRLLLPDESGMRIGAGYSTGMAGGIDFLLRLSRGGGRPWMVEFG